MKHNMCASVVHVILQCPVLEDECDGIIWIFTEGDRDGFYSSNHLIILVGRRFKCRMEKAEELLLTFSTTFLDLLAIIRKEVTDTVCR